MPRDNVKQSRDLAEIEPLQHVLRLAITEMVALLRYVGMLVLTGTSVFADNMACKWANEPGDDSILL